MQNKGSLWRRWDLHFHSPSSHDYKDKSLSDTDIVNALVENDIRCVCITDHNLIDVDRIRNLQTIASGQLTVLPGIEFCSELGGSQAVHFIGIFSEKSDIEEIWANLSVRLEIRDKDIEARGGHQHIYTDLRDAAEIIHEMHGVVSVHAGSKSGSLEEISSRHLFKQSQKKDLIKDQVVDILEIGKRQDIDDYLEIVFPSIEEHVPLIICSDNHTASSYEVRANCWIKADPTFNGLIQALIEPEERIFIGEHPPKRRLVAKRKTKFISGLSVRKSSDSGLEDTWFGVTDLEFNHDLVAIIGNKGSGKSALVEIIGLLADSRSEQSFEFLHKDRFRDPKNNLADNFRATLTWASGSTVEKALSEHINEGQPELVRCLPQGLFEDICNDIAEGPDNRFYRELMSVIFNHIPATDTHDKTSLQELIDFLTKEKLDAIEIVREELHKINSDIVRLEEKSSPDNKSSLEAQLASKKEDLLSLEDSKPNEVSKPKSSSAPVSELNQAIETKQANVRALRSALEALERKSSRYNRIMKAADKLLDTLQNIQSRFQAIEKESKSELDILGLSISDIATLTISRDPLHDKRAEAKSRKLAIDKASNPEVPSSLARQLSKLEEDVGALQKRLSKADQEYQDYVGALEEWEKERAAIMGNATEPDSIKFLEKEIEQLEAVPGELARLRKSRKALSKKIYEMINELTNTYKDLHSPIQSFIDEYDISQSGFEMDLDVSIIDTGFTDRFFDWIGRNVAGSFYGPDGETILESIVDKHNFNKSDEAIAFLDEIADHILHDKRDGEDKEMQVSQQLKKNRDAVGLYDFIFGLDYLEPVYYLRLDKKHITMLSPGERGALLLIFYLLIDADDTPLIIDQPEENLDNQTVYKVLVETIKEAKKERQIILVTHNPNLAVVCDAEQIIHCSLDKTSGNALTYSTGSIEDPLMNPVIVDVLEGTMPALTNRWEKYSVFRNISRD